MNTNPDQKPPPPAALDSKDEGESLAIHALVTTTTVTTERAMKLRFKVNQAAALRQGVDAPTQNGATLHKHPEMLL